MTHVLPDLPYAYDALEPTLSAEAMKLHHDKHHKAYVDKLNEALAAYPDLQKVPVEQLLRDLDQVPAEIRTAIRNQGGGHANHSLYWKVFTPGGSDLPASLKAKIERDFGSVDAFKAKFEETGVKLFGSGWAWLVADGDKLEVLGLPNQDSPLSQGKIPLLLCDVWEHAYYPDYENRRPEWLKSWWAIVDWEAAAERLADAQPSTAMSSDDRRPGDFAS